MTLTNRLSAFFLATLAAVLLGFSLSLYLLARGYLNQQAEDRLCSALDTLAAAVEREPNGLEWEAQQRHLTLGQGQEPEEVRWEVRDGEGTIVARSPNLEGAGLPQGQGLAAGHWRLARRELKADGTPSGEKSDADKRLHERLVLTAGLDVRPVRKALRSLAVALGVLSAGLWLGSALAGRWMCRRALAPLAEMAGSAREMDVADLGHRLTVPDAGDELADLGHAFNHLLGR